MRIVNLTPHAITVCNAEGAPLATFSPSGSVARVAVSREPMGHLGGTKIPLFRSQFGALVGLPDFNSDDDAVFIVSAIVAQHPDVVGRGDVLSPGDLVRGPDGQPVGCKGLTLA
jgi:hypothetical protein